MAVDIKHPGAYRSQTGTPAGEDIPASRIERDLKARSVKTRRRAQFAKNARVWTRERHLTASLDALVEAAATLPRVHLNGTSAKSLLEDLSEAMHALQAAEDAVGRTMPNGRDYYPDGPDAIRSAVREHTARMQKLRDVYSELEELALHVSKFESASAETASKFWDSLSPRTWTRGRHLTASRDAPEHTLVVKYDDDGTLRKLVRELNRLGAQGASRTVSIEDDEGFRVGWDGDGADKIWSAEVDGESILDRPSEAASVATASKFWDSLSPRERRAYLRAHPHSKHAQDPSASPTISQHLKSRGWVKRADHWAHPESRRKLVVSRGGSHKHRIAVTHANGDVTVRNTDSDRVLRAFTARMARRPKSGISAALKSKAGSLHEHLGVPHGSPIPLGKLARLADSDHPLAGRARLVLNLKRARARGPVDYTPAK